MLSLSARVAYSLSDCGQVFVLAEWQQASCKRVVLELLLVECSFGAGFVSRVVQGPEVCSIKLVNLAGFGSGFIGLSNLEVGCLIEVVQGFAGIFGLSRSPSGTFFHFLVLGSC